MKTKMINLKSILVLTLITLASFTSFSQNFAYVDTEYILENIPDYKDAQEELDKLSIEWQKQLERRYAEIDKMYKNYQAEQILLTEDMKTKREDEIIKKEINLSKTSLEKDREKLEKKFSTKKKETIN